MTQPNSERHTPGDPPGRLSWHWRWLHRPHPRWVSIATLGAAAALLATIVFVAAPDLTHAAEPSLSVQRSTPRIVAPAPTATIAKSAGNAEAASKLTWTTTTYSEVFGGLRRSYVVVRPATASAVPLPMVVDLGGCCTTVAVEMARADFRQVTGPAIIVYPEYVDGNWDAGACCGQPVTDRINDVGFVNSVIAGVKTSQPDASTGPVYLAGYSNGGKLATMMACQEPAAFAAVAVYGATRTSDCPNLPAEPVLVMVGSADPGTAISGTPVVQNGYVEPTVGQLVADYRLADGCSPSVSNAMTAGIASGTLWTQCAGGRQVGVVVYEGANHTWPETSGPTPSAQQVMWHFFVSLGA